MPDMPDLTLQPKLGLLPNDGSRPFLKVELPAAALTAPPAAVDWFAKLTVPLGMYGNDQVGDCVVAAFIHDLLVTWCATHPGQVPPRVPTTQDALNFYWSINTDHVDRGLMTQTALEKLLATGIGGYKPLCFATVDLSVTNVRAITAFFVSAILSVEIDQADYYPAKLLDYVPGSPFLGYHGISSGSLASGPDRTGIATWGYVAQLTDAYITHKIQAVDVIIWPWVYNALPSETADKLAADFKALTGRTLPPQVLPTPPSDFHWHVQHGASGKTYKLDPTFTGSGPAPILPGWTTTIWTGPDSSAPCTKPVFRPTVDGKSHATTVQILSGTLVGRVVGVGPPGTSVS